MLKMNFVMKVLCHSGKSKTLSRIICFFTILSFYSQAQSNKLVVTYEVSFKKFVDSKNYSTREAQLVVDGQATLFTWSKQLLLAQQRENRVISEIELMQYNVDPSFIIFKNNSNLSYYEQIGKEIFNYEESLKHDWKLSKDSKTILQMKCQKASTFYAGREWIVWYTKDIGVTGGPYKFYGLPGLILEANSADGAFTFKAQDIFKIKESIPLSYKTYFIDQTVGLVQSNRLKTNNHRFSYDQLPINEKLKYMNKENANYNYNFVTIDDAGNKEIFRNKPRAKNYFELNQIDK